MSSFGDLRELLDDTLMRAHGYTSVAQFPGRGLPVLIYGRMPSPPAPLPQGEG